MRILFAHDCKFFYDPVGDLHYSDGQFPYALWRRYLEVFSEITVAARFRPIEANTKLDSLDQSSGPGVRFVEIPSISSPLAMITKRSEATRLLAHAMQECDGVVSRVSEIGTLAFSVAETLKKPRLVEVVGDTFAALWHYGNWQGKLYAPFSDRATRKMIRRAPFATYVTKQWLQQKYPCNGRSLACSDVQVVSSDESVRIRRRKRLADCSGFIRIGLIASLTNRYKGIDVALAALRKLGKMRAGVRLFVLGGGDSAYWQKVARKEGVEDVVEFCGVLPGGEAVDAWLDSIDVYMQPSYLEGLPRSLIEAMNRGCPAVASRIGGIPELLDEDCLHRRGDATHLAELLRLAINDSNWRKRNSERNFRKADEYDAQILDQTRFQFWREFVTASEGLK